jgi:nucleoid-associated protein YgaU
VKIFLSYASKYRTIADDLCCRLQAVGHEVFFDREDLPPGTSFDDRIHSAIESCELFIFMISPEAVEDGRYTRTELKIASRKWPTPGWHVLPVQMVDTPLEDVPAYLRALTIMQAEGNLAAEVVLEVQDRVRTHGKEKPKLESIRQADKPDQAHYRSLHLRFARGKEGSYAITVPDSLSGAHTAEGFMIDTTKLEHALWSGAQPIGDSARRPANNSELTTLLPSSQNVRELGQALYNTLFNSPLKDCLDDSLRAIDPQQSEGLRFVIDTTETPDLARLPWEFLYSPAKDDFLFSDRMKPVIRWLNVDEPPPTLRVEPPLRILMAIAAPTDRQGLQVGEEIAQLDHALNGLSEKGQVNTIRLDHASLESLDNALLQSKPHILHFIGHGDFIDNEGFLVLESDEFPGKSDIITGRQLAVLLRNHLSSLRLVFLNSCMGATASRSDPFGGVAQNLIRRGIPAVIAMQFPIPDKAAVSLSKHFYRYLAAGQPVDTALTSARAFLYARGYTVEWGAPALHMRTPDGHLFDIVTTPVAAPSPVVPVLPTEAPPPQPTPSTQKSHRNGLIVAACLVIFLLVAVYWLVYSNRSLPIVEPPEINPAVITPPPKLVPDPIDKALALLKSGNPTDTIAILEEALTSNPSALSANKLGDRHTSLALALGNAIENAFRQGDNELGFKLADLLTAMEPFDAAVEVQINEQVGAWLAAENTGPELTPTAGGPDDQTYVPLVYTVRPGDNLWVIARRLTGDGRNWQKLVKYHNRKVELGLGGRLIKNPQRINPGLKIFIPLSTSAPGANAFDYHVSPGESLSRIAKRIYGNPQLWEVIYRDNSPKIINPDLIFPGQILLLRANTAFEP